MAEKLPQYVKFIRRTFYRNATFPEGVIIDPKAYGLEAADLENLRAMGQLTVLSDSEIEEHEQTDALRRSLPATQQAEIAKQDKVVQMVGGIDVAWPDPRVKGPNEPKDGDPKIERLPPDSLPTGTPVGVIEAAQDTARRLRVNTAPEPLPPRPEGEAAREVPPSPVIPVVPVIQPETEDKKKQRK